MKSNLKASEMLSEVPRVPRPWECEILAKWEREFPPIRRPPAKPKNAEAPQVTVEALVYQLREHGLAELQKPSCLGRLADLSTEQLREVIGRLVRLQPKYPKITNELLTVFEELLQ